MFNANEDKRSWVPFIVASAATAALSTLGAELIRWGVDELRGQFGTKKPATPAAPVAATLAKPEPTPPASSV